MNYKPVKKKVIVRYIESVGFYYVGGKSHDKYIKESGGKTYTVMIPRHTSRSISPGVVDSITKYLVVDCSFSETDVKNHLK